MTLCRFRYFLIGIFSLIGTLNVSAASFPSQAPLGAATIHRYEEPFASPSQIAVTVWVPTTDLHFPGILINLNSAQLPVSMPHRWLIGDGGLTRAFVGIDMSPKSELFRQVEDFVSKGKALGLNNPEQWLEFLRIRTNQVLRWTPLSNLNNGAPEFEWDLAISVPISVNSAFQAAGTLPIFHFPVPAETLFPVVPLEKYILAGQGYCLQKAVWASLILGRLGISHRLVNGAVSTGIARSTGHTWIELTDGRILDVAWEFLGAPQRGHSQHPDWLLVSGSWRFENENYLILALPEY